MTRQQFFYFFSMTLDAFIQTTIFSITVRGRDWFTRLKYCTWVHLRRALQGLLEMLAYILFLLWLNKCLFFFLSFLSADSHGWQLLHSFSIHQTSDHRILIQYHYELISYYVAFVSTQSFPIGLSYLRIFELLIAVRPLLCCWNPNGPFNDVDSLLWCSYCCFDRRSFIFIIAEEPTLSSVCLQVICFLKWQK